MSYPDWAACGQDRTKKDHLLASLLGPMLTRRRTTSNDSNMDTWLDTPPKVPSATPRADAASTSDESPPPDAATTRSRTDDDWNVVVSPKVRRKKAPSK